MIVREEEDERDGGTRTVGLAYHVLVTREETCHTIWNYAGHVRQQITVVTDDSCRVKIISLN